MVNSSDDTCTEESQLRYLAVQTHPAAIEGLFAEPGGSTQVVFPCGGIDHLQPLVPNRPVHAEVGSFARLAGLSVAYSFERKKTKTKKKEKQMGKLGFVDNPTKLNTHIYHCLNNTYAPISPPFWNKSIWDTIISQKVEIFPFLTTEQRPVQTEWLRQVLNLCNPLVHGPGEVVCVVQAAQDDAGKVNGLCEVAHQRALEPDHVPPGEGQKQDCLAQSAQKTWGSSSCVCQRAMRAGNCGQRASWAEKILRGAFLIEVAPLIGTDWRIRGALWSLWERRLRTANQCQQCRKAP